jgi:enediyne biosynthesis thioesterase
MTTPITSLADVEVTHTITPRITFQDTNIVGNVYFLTFFRWQSECRDAWLRTAMPEVWAARRCGGARLLVSNWSNRFEDAFGATIGDPISVALRVHSQDQSSVLLSMEVLKHDGPSKSRLASGIMKFRIESATADAEHEHEHEHENCASRIETQDGPSYALLLRTPIDHDLQAIDLVSWQGKCRELFLEDQTDSIERQVTQRELILQTTTASLDWTGPVPQRDQAVRVEMRLESLKCGQMGVSFNYAIDEPGELSGVSFAAGHQSMSSKHMVGTNLLPCPLPSELLQALREYTHSTRLIGKIEDILQFAEPTHLPQP